MLALFTLCVRESNSLCIKGCDQVFVQKEPSGAQFHDMAVFRRGQSALARLVAQHAVTLLRMHVIAAAHPFAHPTEASRRRFEVAALSLKLTQRYPNSIPTTAMRPRGTSKHARPPRAGQTKPP